MNKVVRTTLTKVTLSAIPIHISIALVISPWILQAVDRICRSFIWIGTASAVANTEQKCRRQIYVEVDDKSTTFNFISL
jgi:hypothetical protein